MGTEIMLSDRSVTGASSLDSSSTPNPMPIRNGSLVLAIGSVPVCSLSRNLEYFVQRCYYSVTIDPLFILFASLQIVCDGDA